MDGTAVSCPNCNQPAIKTGNEILCQACDATYVIKKKDGAPRVQELSPLDKINGRLTALEKQVNPEEQEPEPEPTAPGYVTTEEFVEQEEQEEQEEQQPEENNDCDILPRW